MGGLAGRTGKSSVHRTASSLLFVEPASFNVRCVGGWGVCFVVLSAAVRLSIIFVAAKERLE